MTRPTLSVVIPCHNEEKAIPEVLAKIEHLIHDPLFLNQFESLDLIVVDDGSTDNSSHLLSQQNLITTLIRNRTCLGYGYALKQGFQMAKGDFIAFLDMDSSYEPMNILDLYQNLQQTQLDIVFGSRKQSHMAMPWMRRIGNEFFAHSVNLFFGKKFSDVCTGMRLFRRRLLPDVLTIPFNDLNYSLALTLKVIFSPHIAGEYPIDYMERSGSSKLSVVKDGFSFLFVLLITAFKGLPRK